MKKDNINFCLILIVYFSIGLFFNIVYVQNERLKVMNDSINRLITIELITEEQFSLLHDKVKDLEKRSRAGLTIADGMVY
jgi:uncharacterized membrane protein YobD (UPF0266 family)